MTSQLSKVSATARKFIERTHHMLVDGEWRPPGGALNDVIDPSTEERVGEFHSSTPQDVNDAIAAARRAFDASAWRETAPAARL